MVFGSKKSGHPGHKNLPALQVELKKSKKERKKAPPGSPIALQLNESIASATRQIKTLIAADEERGSGHFPKELVPFAVRGHVPGVCPVCAMETNALCRCFVMDSRCGLGHAWFTCKSCDRVSWVYCREEYEQCVAESDNFTDHCRPISCQNPDCAIIGTPLNGDDVIDWATGANPRPVDKAQLDRIEAKREELESKIFDCERRLAKLRKRLERTKAKESKLIELS